jgi:arabinogalactan endo-1,4-beta-galactosidase
MKPPFDWFLICILIAPSLAQTWHKGADLSYVNELEQCGVVWKQNNKPKDIFVLFKECGATIVRFRIWHTPETFATIPLHEELDKESSQYASDVQPLLQKSLLDRSGYSDVTELMSRAKAAGLKTILDFHYSDTWTDPSHQRCPSAWINVVDKPSYLADSLYQYTRSVLTRLKSNNLSPDFIQVGNETNGGMCFGGDGSVTWPTDWNKQRQLYNAGIRAVREVIPSSKIILHVADPQHATWWAGELKKNSVTNYDIIGISFYPLIHTTKSISDVGAVIRDLKKNFSKDVMIVETALPWTGAWDDTVRNMMSGVPSGYGTTESPHIQAKWLIDMSNEVKSSGGLGVVYWAPEWVASHKPGCVRDFGGSTWENMTFFDFNHNLIDNGGITFIGTPVSTGDCYKDQVQQQHFKLTHNNSIFLPTTPTQQTNLSIKVFSLSGEHLKSFNITIDKGGHTQNVPLSDNVLPSGLCIIKITCGANVSFVTLNTMHQH